MLWLLLWKDTDVLTSPLDLPMVDFGHMGLGDVAFFFCQDRRHLPSVTLPRDSNQLIVRILSGTWLHEEIWFGAQDLTQFLLSYNMVFSSYSVFRCNLHTACMLLKCNRYHVLKQLKVSRVGWQIVLTSVFLCSGCYDVIRLFGTVVLNKISTHSERSLSGSPTLKIGSQMSAGG